MLAKCAFLGSGRMFLLPLSALPLLHVFVLLWRGVEGAA